MAKDRLSELYKGLLYGSLKLLGIGILVVLIVMAAFFGFALDFASCFGRSSCEGFGGIYVLILPIGILAAGVFIIVVWSNNRKTKYRETIRNELIEEDGVVRKGSLDEQIINLLAKHKRLTSAELQKMTSSDKDSVLETTRALLQSQKITQVQDHTGFYFTLSR